MVLRKVLIILGLCLLLIFSEGLWHPAIAQADIRQHEYIPGEMIYQSRQSMRDIDRRPWQVVVFKKVRDDGFTSGISLRLVGYPNQVTFRHPADLTIDTKFGRSFLATDQFAEDPPAPSVGQYDITEILPEFPTDQPLILQMPTEQAVTLKIPISVVLEWKEIP